jgi:multidrug transporter EmrE-like cation transporter
MSASLGLILFGVLLNAAAQLLLKAGTNTVGRFAFTADNFAPVATQLAMEPRILAGVACYGVSLVVWVMGLSRTEVSVAYPMLSLGFAINAAAAWFLLGESVSPARLAGVALIIGGVVVVARS